MSVASESLDRLILQGQVLTAVRWIMGTYECGLADATCFLYARYDELRRSRPGDFAKSHEEYWRGVYT
ncbi:hypothetical protein D0T12_30785 [Actinomadura spongiicola]|uniref:Uncharacterized protein n=1 Tax=Actinomadura spongiicola TaxID=2303421 RepID=A0A372G8G2_9ACTN|nr:hypothetical protein D0T12_30785 [Actinomadura spongiicola]